MQLGEITMRTVRVAICFVLVQCDPLSGNRMNTISYIDDMYIYIYIYMRERDIYIYIHTYIFMRTHKQMI